jgi:hypothetical protein
MPFIDPNLIRIDRDTRQRRVIDQDRIEEMKKSLTKSGQIHPIVLRNEGPDMVLVVGERRLISAKELGWPLIEYTLRENLSLRDSKKIELEENIKRLDIPWQDQVKAVGEFHAFAMEEHKGKWNNTKTADELCFEPPWVGTLLLVYKHLNTPLIASATGIRNAESIIKHYSDRAAEQAVQNIIAASVASAQEKTVGVGAGAVSTPQMAQEGPEKSGPNAGPAPMSEAHGAPSGAGFSAPQANGPAPISGPQPKPSGMSILPPEPVINADFIKWINNYSGPKFNLIHCDFPYGTYKGDDSTGKYIVNEFYDNTPDVYWALTNALVQNLDKVMSYSAHMMFWFDMKFYTETRAMFLKAGLDCHPHPLVWHKTNGGVQPGTATTHPRRTMDTAFLCVKGSRPLARPGPGSYGAPMPHNKRHPSQKPEPMLREFMKMFVDETTVMLDPTCGSGSSLKAAEDLGARTVFGLELDPDHAKASNSYICLSTFIGWFISMGSQIAILPWFGIHVPVSTNLYISLIFTVISVIRGYFVRRLFNWLHVKGL